MANATVDYWDIDGTSLQTLAFDITTLGGRLAPPPLRGDNVTIPHMPGQKWTPKIVDSQTLTLAMYVIGATEDGGVPTGPASYQFDDNLRKLRQLLWQPRRQFSITKRFRVGGVQKTATALGQYAGGLDPEMTGRTRATFTASVFLADPYFYGSQVNTNLTQASQTVTVEGDDVTNNILFHVVGPRKNVKVRNATLNTDWQLLYDHASGDFSDIDVKAFTSVTDPAATPAYSSSGSIRHTGDASWFILQPGANTIEVSSDSGAGLVTMTHRAAWL